MTRAESGGVESPWRLAGEVNHVLTAMYVRIHAPITSDEGATALEYGVLVLLVAIAIIVGVTAYGTSLNAFIAALWGRTGL
jgi:Flp pilus assembly pilin Flp